MITRSSLSHPTVRIRICQTMLTAIQRARTAKVGVAFVTPSGASNTLRMGVMYEPQFRRFTFIGADQRDLTPLVNDVFAEAHRRLATMEAA